MPIREAVTGEPCGAASLPCSTLSRGERVRVAWPVETGFAATREVAPSSFPSVRCPACSSVDDKVVDSRASEDGSAIRRRRECLVCGGRFTTFERVDEVPLMVVKRSGEREPFSRDKIVAGLRAATKNRPVAPERLDELAAAVEERLRLGGPELASKQIGVAVLERLRELDQVSYLRFLSVYKEFDDPADFEREVILLTKATEPNHSVRSSVSESSGQPER